MADYRINVNAGYNLTKLRGVPAMADFPAPSLPIVTRPGPVPQSMRADTSGGLRAPQLDAGMLFYDVGSSGLRQFSGWVREEFLPQLQGREAARAYREMLDNSATIGGLIFALQATMRKVEWRVEPADDSPEAAAQAEFFEGCKDDMSHTWHDFVIEAQSMLGYGFAPHEIVYKRRLGHTPPKDPRTGEPLPESNFKDGKIGWRRLPLRGQDTIIKWFFGAGGEIKGITQQPWTGPIIDIPIEKMLLFRPTSHKNNPEGRSILRTAYRSYYMAKRMEELEQIMFERMGGIPVISVPKELMDRAAEGDTQALAQLDMWKRIATNVRIDEQMGLVIPSDQWTEGAGATAPMYKFELATPQGGRGQAVKSDDAIERYNLNMLSSVLADFIALGHAAHGTQSLATVKTDMFFQASEGFLNSQADTLNRYGVARLSDLNGMNRDKNPEYKPDMPQRMDLDVLSNFLLRLSQAGMPLFPNETLETAVLDAAGLPDVMEDEARTLLVDQQAEEDEIHMDQQRLSLEQSQVRVQQMKDNPQGQGGDRPPGGGQTKLEKAIAGSLARRIIYHGGSAHRMTPRQLKRANGRAAA